MGQSLERKKGIGNWIRSRCCIFEAYWGYWARTKERAGHLNNIPPYTKWTRPSAAAVHVYTIRANNGKFRAKERILDVDDTTIGTVFEHFLRNSLSEKSNWPVGEVPGVIRRDRSLTHSILNRPGGYSGFRLKRPLIRRPIGYKDQYFWSQNLIMQ